MRKAISIALCLLTAVWTYGQSLHDQFIGVNILQLPALTLNANYSMESKPFLTPTVDVGYAFNYQNSFDFIGNILTTHCKCENDGYHVENLTGAYLKFGTFLNLRKSFEKNNFFHLGVFLTNSLVHESGDYRPQGESEPDLQSLTHTIYVPGFSFSGGYEFSFFRKLKSNIDFQISLPGKNYEELYGYRNFIPGMGYRDFEKYWFPMLIWNIKYKL
ncbi:MAG: hypothetical protein ACM3ME_07900 [Chloroflexota bacterium]